MKEKNITEWTIIFKDNEEFFTENEFEYNEKIQELKENNKIDTIYQAYMKDYEWNELIEDYQEINVEILIDNI